jgi:hypothetical protein
MKNIFYCPKCNKSGLNFELHCDMATWCNTRDGYGRPITHIICPYCNYELAGVVNVSGLKMDEDNIEYFKSIIRGYSDNTYVDTEELLKLIRKDIKI